MKEFPNNIRFKYNWRQYQKRVLDELEKHLDDNHLHVIAPPGSGKTVLGLEVALRLNKPTLIFAPTIAIRNQWIHRFCELFLQVIEEPEWISRDINNPKFLTVVTYQSLHAACTNTVIEENELVEEESDNNTNAKVIKTIDPVEIVKKLKKQGIGTIIVDEAHHLKNEWWKSLNAVKNALNPTIVGLTATPPYDVSYSEWQRYIDLNGQVDTEISVPELVLENDLCPHQDYLYLSEPTDDEEALIRDQREKTKRVFEEIANDDFFIQAIMSHPIYISPEENLEWIYNNFEYYCSILIFLNAIEIEISESKLEVIGDKKFNIPSLNFKWIEILLTFYLFEENEYFNTFEEHKEKLINKLKRNGLLDRKTINFINNQRINRSLSTSLSKLQSIDHIVDIEHDTLGNNLRMVILTDYIRKEFLTNEPNNFLTLSKIGVMPIFEQLRRTNNRNMKLGVLSGSIIIIPETALENLIRAANKRQIDAISYTPLAYDKSYLIINTNEMIKHNIVQLVTSIFESGEIEVLIGTKSLLGEGWDAPTINSLILASFVGSYVLSNQIRGRAIRADRRNPNKTGNIWHLVCVDTTVPDGGEEIQLMKRRFKSFVGISDEQEVSIENGINRLNLPEVFSKSEIEFYNEKTIQKVGERDLLKQKWADALANGNELIEEIKVPFAEEKSYKQVKSLYYNKTIANLLFSLGSGLLIYAEGVLRSLSKSIRYLNNNEDILRWLTYIGISGIVFFGKQSYKTFNIYFKYRDIAKDVRKIGEALLQTLVNMGIIQTDISKLTVVSSVDINGAIYCHLSGGTIIENSTFTKSLLEIVSPIENPRYLILRKNSFFKVFSQSDYHSVPEIIGRNKKTSEYFEKQWRKIVGACELIYTRTLDGRKKLLKSRMNSLSSEFVKKSERINKWR